LSYFAADAEEPDKTYQNRKVMITKESNYFLIVFYRYLN